MVDQLMFVAATSKAVKTAKAEVKTAEPDPLKGGDVYKWALEQAAHIRAGRFDKIDLVNVADEIESVAKSEFRSLISRLAVLLAHMLKWDNQRSKRSRSWVNSIVEQRAQITDDLSDSPSMRHKLEEALERGYRTARSSASSQTKLPIATFPAKCPYDWDAIMNRSFVLDQTDEAS